MGWGLNPSLNYCHRLVLLEHVQSNNFSPIIHLSNHTTCSALLYNIRWTWRVHGDDVLISSSFTVHTQQFNSKVNYVFSSLFIIPSKLCHIQETGQKIVKLNSDTFKTLPIFGSIFYKQLIFYRNSNHFVDLMLEGDKKWPVKSKSS